MKILIKRVINIFKKTFWTKEKYLRHTGVKIGQNCSIDTLLFGSEPYLIEIGNHVQVTSGVKFFTHGGGWVFRDKHPLMDTFGKIKIGDNVYIGNNAMLMPGVTIGNDVIVGAGAIVTKSVPNGSIVAGNPARIIGTLDDLEKRIVGYNLNSKNMSNVEKKKFLLSLNDEKFLKK
jgi:acetyltransferase-like isoleucine patch superfamily enzyme